MPGSSRTVVVTAKWKPRCWVAGVLRSNGRPVNRWSGHTVEVDGVTLIVSTGGTEIWRTTGADRQAPLDPMITEAKKTPHDPDREYLLRLEPAADEVCNAPAGPDLGTTSAPSSAKTFEKLFRPLEITFKFDADYRIVDPQAQNTQTQRGPHGMAVVHEKRSGSTQQQTLDIDWKPDWIRRGSFGGNPLLRPLSRSRGAGRVASVLVLHRTGKMGSSLNTFLGPRLSASLTKKGIHYMIDIDGHVVKMCHEDLAVNHTGNAGWKGATPLGNHSIGIEHINPKARPQPPYPEDQIRASLDLVSSIRTASSIEVWNLAGHADVKTTGLAQPMTLDRSSRAGCPGKHFFWDRLEAAGDALTPDMTMVPPAAPYGYFSDPALRSLRRNDRDRGRRYGGRRRTAAQVPVNTVIADMHRDLNRIGWSPIIATPNGNFDNRMEIMVLRFQARFHIRPVTGRIDRETAIQLLRVISAMDALGAP